MSTRPRRRRTPAPVPQVKEPVAEVQEASAPEPETDTPVLEASMGPKSEPQPKAPPLRVALGRCRYSTVAGKLVNAEPGDVITDPNLEDLACLEEANLIEFFDQATVTALQDARDKNKAALKAILGL